ncbi:MAG: ribokinase [Hyphomicrobiales bacterium]
MTKAGTVVVIGSLHYDIVVAAPDRPRKGETVIGSRWHPKFGGKGGNQAVAAARAGSEVRFVGAVGDDDFSNFLLEELKLANINSNYISKSTKSGSGMSVAILDEEGDYGAVIVSGANAEIDTACLANAALWKNAKVLVLQNEVPTAVNLAAARAAKMHGLQVCLNAAPSRALPQELLNSIDILVVNAIEAEDLCGLPVASLKDAEKAASKLIDLVPTVIVTAGGDGVTIASAGGEFSSLAALPVDVVSTLGAGDMFVGTLCASLAAGNDSSSALSAANRAAAHHVSAATKI